MSPAGEALTTLPPIVPRFWIWAAPIVAAHRPAPAACSRAAVRAADLRVRRQRADRQHAVADADAAQLVEPPEVEHALGRRADLAGDLDHQVRAAGDRPEGVRRRSSREASRRVRGERRRLDGHRRRSDAPARPCGRDRDRLDDLGVAGAAAEVAGDRLADASSSARRRLRRGTRGAAMSMPGVQMPHCAPPASRNACWSGSSSPGGRSGEALDRANDRRRRPGRRARGRSRRPAPSTRTEQAPHSPSPQPSFVPVRPRSSRSTSSRRRMPGTSSVTPLTVSSYAISGHRVVWPAHGLRVSRRIGGSSAGRTRRRRLTPRRSADCAASRSTAGWRRLIRRAARIRSGDRGQVVDPDAGRIVDRRDDRRRPDVHGQLADALGAVRRAAERLLDEDRRDPRRVERRSGSGRSRGGR